MFLLIVLGNSTEFIEQEHLNTSHVLINRAAGTVKKIGRLGFKYISCSY